MMMIDDDLIEACIINDVDQAKLCIEKGADPHYEDELPIRVAADNLSVNIIKYLYSEYKCDLFCYDSPLSSIIEHETSELVVEIMEYFFKKKIWKVFEGREIMQFMSTFKMFVWAMRNQRLDLMKFTIQDGFDIRNISFGYEHIYKMNYEMLQYILDQGAKICKAIVYYDNTMYKHWVIHNIIVGDKCDLFRCFVENKLDTGGLESMIIKGSKIEQYYHTLKKNKEMYNVVMRELEALPGASSYIKAKQRFEQNQK
jgi:hypothetical protein